MQEHIIAKKYAKALASICQPNEIAQVHAIYVTLSQAFSVAKFRTIVASHMVGRSQKLDFLKSLVDISTNAHAERLLTILVQNDRIALLPFVTLELKKIIDSQLNVYEAVLYAKETLGESTLTNIQEKLGRKLGVTLRVTQHIEPNLEGIRLEVADLGVEVAFLKHKFTQELQDFILRAI